MPGLEGPNNRNESLESLEEVVTQALIKASEMHDALGTDGEKEIQKNIHGETALKADVECEKVVLDVLRNAGTPIRVYSEEHGQVDLANAPRYIGVLDGLDGSSVYKKERGVGRYATMFGIFGSTNPSYGDYLVSGIMEHVSKRLYIASNGGGAFVVERGVKTPIRTSGRVTLEVGTNIYIDTYFEVCRRVFESRLEEYKHPNFNFSSGSSAVTYADVASGAADMSLECTRKGNLEIAAMYGLVTEAGGAVVDISGLPLKNRKYLEFGQGEGVNLPIITAASSELAQSLVLYLKEKN